MLREYRALVEKVAAFSDATSARRAADLTCSAGCSSCCHAWLTVNPVEAAALRLGLAALPAERRERVRARGLRELAREAAAEPAPRCAMLGDDERCDVYEQRPLVCRTQGHALRYPAGLIPTAAIARKTANGEETWCPLNYHAAVPTSADVLDAERVDQILAVVAARYVAAEASQAGQQARPSAARDANLAAETRVALSQLAADEEVLNDPTGRDAQRQATER